MIKYRVFDIIQNKYIDSKDVSIDGNGVLTVVGVEGKYDMSVQPPNDLAPRFIIEQYTGLKDKNGVEIAVGDIELSELLWDMLDLLHDYDWYISGDTGFENWDASRKAFKRKWLSDNRTDNLKTLIEKKLAEVKDEQRA